MNRDDAKQNNLRKLLKQYLSDDWFKFIIYVRNFWREYINNKQSERKIRKLLKKDKVVRIELGASEKREGWLTIGLAKGVDLKYNVRELLPFPEYSIERIYTSHFLEHFAHDDLINLLKECHRILQKGGIFSVAVPNAKIYVDAYLGKQIRLKDGLPHFHYYGRIDYLNYIAYMGNHHRFMFDTENLIAILKNVGFARSAIREFDPNLDLFVRKDASIYAEAIK